MQQSTDKRAGGRRRVGRVLTELHCRLRTEGGTPLRQAASVGLGTWIGCTPLYGVHVFLCAGAARLLGLSRVTTYLAAHINNPLTAPLLFYVDYGVGYLLFNGSWPSVGMGALGQQSWLGLGRDLMVGSLVVGFVLGLALGALSYQIGRYWQMPALERLLRERTSQRYVDAGVFTWELVRSKIKLDPLYLGVLRSDLLPSAGKLTDYGCGRGTFLALIATARELRAEGKWDDRLPPSEELVLEGIEGNARIARIAEAALGDDASIETADLDGYEPTAGAAALIFDVLHYLSPDAQENLLCRVCASLEPGGRLLIRETDTSPVWRHLLTRGGERLNALLRGHWRQGFHYRSSEAWCEILRSHGLTARARPLWRRTPFSNVLIEGRKPEAG